MITVLGTVALDAVGRTDRLPAPDEAVRIQSLGSSFGGTAGNVAMALGRLGVGARLVAAVGDDFASSGYEAALRKVGVDLADVVRASEPSAHAFQFADAAHRQHIYFFPGPAARLADAPVREAGILHAAAGEFPAYVPHLQAARTVTLDFGQELFHRPFAQMEPLVPLADVLFVNRHERARLETLGWPIDRALSAGVRAVVETLGAEGAILRTSGGSARIPAVAARVHEPTGAGDAHRAGFLFALSEGADDETACRVGAVVAAFAVEHAGPQAGLPDAAALVERYEGAFGSWPL